MNNSPEPCGCSRHFRLRNGAQLAPNASSRLGSSRTETPPLRSILLWVTLCAALIVSACDYHPTAPVRVGAIVWPGYECLFLARSLGFYDESAIQLVEYPSTPEVIRAFQNGAVDVAALTGDEFVRIATRNPEVRIIAILDESQGADVILGRPGITNLAQIKGRRIGFEPNSTGAYLFTRALTHAGLSLADVQTVHVPNVQHVEAFQKGTVDVVVTFQPNATRLLRAGAARIFDSRQIPGEIPDFLVAQRHSITKRKSELKSLLQGWFNARDYLEQNTSEAADRIAARQGITREEFLQSLDELRLFNLRENLRMFNHLDDDLAPRLRSIADTLYAARMIAAPLDPKPFFDAEILDALRP